MSTTSAFETLVAQQRGPLLAYCYRMLGSWQDAEDVLQDALVGAWKGYDGFEGRSSARTWLYTIATNACLRQRRRRVTSPEVGPAYDQVDDLGEPTGLAYVEPAADPALLAERRETVELAYVTALQHLPDTQRAVLILREVLQFSAAEVAEQLDTSVASVNSALQRARATIARTQTGTIQQQELARLGDDGVGRLVQEFMDAWESADVDRLCAMLTDDVQFTMPPLPAWFSGLAMVRRFLTDRMLQTPWRLTPQTINGQPGFRCEQLVQDGWRPGAVNVLSVRDGRVCAISGYVDPALVERFFLADR
ncbi:MAG TPA: RNA polymerase subunit sigma-70 [Nocardioides sp.]|nr:RNA polymerase subunit sigma-70 [Nocardioides sp.]